MAQQKPLPAGYASPVAGSVLSPRAKAALVLPSVSPSCACFCLGLGTDLLVGCATEGSCKIPATRQGILHTSIAPHGACQSLVCWLASQRADSYGAVLVVRACLCRATEARRAPPRRHQPETSRAAPRWSPCCWRGGRAGHSKWHTRAFLAYIVVLSMPVQMILHHIMALYDGAANEGGCGTGTDCPVLHNHE